MNAPVSPARRPRASFALCALLLVLAACQGATKQRPITGSIRIEATEPGSLDPVRADGGDEVMILRNVFKGLVDYDPVTAAVRPAAALSWRVTPDARQYTFMLRHDDRFSNGELVTADSFVRAFNRVASKAVAAPLGEELSAVLGYTDYRNAKTDHLEGVTALDDYRLQISLVTPDADFVAKLGQPAFSPIPSDAAMSAQKPPFSEAPIGNGPFMVASWEHNESITLKPNPKWYGAKPALSDVTFVLLSDLDLAYDQWKAGNLDWTRVPPAKQGEAAAQNPSRLIKKATDTLLYLVAITDLSPTKSELLRQAVSLAIDRRTISTQLFGGLDPPATGVFPPGMPGYRDPGSGSGPCVFCAYDPARAQTLVASAHLPAGTTLTFAYATATGVDAWAQRVADDVGRTLHLKTQLVSKRPFSDYRAYLAGTKTGQFGALSLTMTYPTPENFLDRLFGPGGDLSLSRWTNVAYDRLASDASGEPNDAIRTGKYRSAEDLVLMSLPIVPLWWEGELRLVDLSRFSKLSMDAFGDPTLDTAVPKKGATG